MAPLNADSIMPPPSFSKAGYMSEISTGTRQLAKGGVQSMKKPGKQVANTVFILPLEAGLDEFGTGEAYDEGRHKELLSSPRENVHVMKRLEADHKANKTITFGKTMSLRFDSDGNLLEAPPPDPVDLKYEKFGVRRPWSSRNRPATCSPDFNTTQQTLQTVSTIPGSTTLQNLTVDTASCTESAQEDVEALQEAQMLAVLESATDEEKCATLRPSSFFLTKATRSLVPKHQSGMPCIGQYNPKFKVIHRSVAKPPDWEKASRVTSPRNQKLKQRGRRPRTAGTKHSSTLGTQANTTGTEGGATQLDRDGDNEGLLDDSEGCHPNQFKKWVERSRTAAETVKQGRPSSAFLTTERRPLMRSTTPDTYWPYNCFYKSSPTAVDMRRQADRWNGAAGTTGGQAPDIVYNLEETRHLQGTCFATQIPRKPLTNQSVHGVSYGSGNMMLSTVPAVRAADFSKISSREANGPKPDTRKDLDVSHKLTQPRPPNGVDYNVQIPRQEYLHPNENVQLQYDPRYAATEKRSQSVHMEWADGHTDVFSKRLATQTDYNPSDELTRARHTSALDMGRGTSRDHCFGAWQKPHSVDQIYDARPAPLPAYAGARFERQVSREKRDSTLKQQCHASHYFYDLPKEKPRGTIPFSKHLPRHKRPPIKC